VASPTIAYTTLESADISPKIVATRSNFKIPTNPQFKPPTMTKTKAIQSNAFSLFIN